MNRRAGVFVFAAIFAAVPVVASAQSIGIGPRLSFVRGDVASGTPSTRLFGGTVRMRTSPHMALELAVDHRSITDLDAATRVRETPIQGSLLMFLGRGTLSPYLLGGFGVYTHMTDTLNEDGLPIETTTERKTGWHLGAGAELFISRRAALFADYRFRFVKFGEPDPDSEPIGVPGLGRLSHRGSMWTGGLAFYF